MAAKRASGPSGEHRQPRKLLTASPEQWAEYQRAAKQHGLTLNAWIRLACDAQAKRKTLG
jgi:hypothetical protein